MDAKLQRRLLVAGLDKPVSQLALGTAWCGLDDKQACFALFDEFLNLGGNALDTARHYGASEDVIGLWLQARGTREEMIVITKGGHSSTGDLVTEDFERTIGREIATSLERLKTDAIDLYLLHRDSPRLPVARIMDCLNAQLERGHIRAFGASNWEYGRIDEANEYAHRHALTPFAAVSNNLALAPPTQPYFPGVVSTDRAGEQWHARTKTPLFSWSSQARGFFTGRYRPEMRRAAARGETDTATTRMIEVYGTDENFERLRRADELGRDKGGLTAVEIALAWVLHRPIDVVPVVGPTTTEELASCVKATGVELTESEAKWLNLET